MNTTKPAIALTALFLFTFATGCQTTGSRFAWWKPSAPAGSSADEPSAVARTAPKLPSDQFAQGKETGVPLADTEATNVKPELTPDTLASAPAAKYSSVFPSSPPAYKPPTSEGAAASTALPTASAGTRPSSVAVAPQAGPYSRVTSPVESPELTAQSPAPTMDTKPSTPTAPVDRYAAAPTDRYSSPPTVSVPPATTGLSPAARPETVASAPPVPKATTGTANFDRYSRYSSTPTETKPPATAALPEPPAESLAPAASKIAASAPSPAPSDDYRPGGTSSYPATPASAVNIATRPTSPESPSTTPPSAYGSPSYR
ncbi:MAG: hypothetical protein ACR2NU_10515 [Aeoliella sp.]